VTTTAWRRSVIVLTKIGCRVAAATVIDGALIDVRAGGWNALLVLAEGKLRVATATVIYIALVYVFADTSAVVRVAVITQTEPTITVTVVLALDEDTRRRRHTVSIGIIEIPRITGARGEIACLVGTGRVLTATTIVGRALINIRAVESPL
jgi:hypothetical protein